MPVTEKVSTELSKITKKRLALESLIRITASIQIQQESLRELSVIAKPSQDFPAKLILHIKQLSYRIGDLPLPELITRLDKIEQVMASSLNQVLLLANIDANELRDEQLDHLSIDQFIDSIGNFKRRTQTAVALRFILKERGVAIAPYSLSIPQESIVVHIDKLRQKEKKCVKQIRKEIVIIIKDSDQITRMNGLTEQMKAEINNVRKAMQVNLEHLDRGGSVKDIPNVFETIVLESEIDNTPTNRVHDEIEDSDVAEISNNQKLENSAAKNSPPEKTSTKKESFWSLFLKWLSSPWNVSWKSIKKQSKK